MLRTLVVAVALAVVVAPTHAQQSIEKTGQYNARVFPGDWIESPTNVAALLHAAGGTALEDKMKETGVVFTGLNPFNGERIVRTEHNVGYDDKFDLRVPTSMVAPRLVCHWIEPDLECDIAVADVRGMVFDATWSIAVVAADGDLDTWTTGRVPLRDAAVEPVQTYEFDIGQFNFNAERKAAVVVRNAADEPVLVRRLTLPGPPPMRLADNLEHADNMFTGSIYNVRGVECYVEARVDLTPLTGARAQPFGQLVASTRRETLTNFSFEFRPPCVVDIAPRWLVVTCDGDATTAYPISDEPLEIDGRPCIFSQDYDNFEPDNQPEPGSFFGETLYVESAGYTVRVHNASDVPIAGPVAISDVSGNVTDWLAEAFVDPACEDIEHFVAVLYDADGVIVDRFGATSLEHPGVPFPVEGPPCECFADFGSTATCPDGRSDPAFALAYNEASGTWSAGFFDVYDAGWQFTVAEADAPFTEVFSEPVTPVTSRPRVNGTVEFSFTSAITIPNCEKTRDYTGTLELADGSAIAGTGLLTIFGPTCPPPELSDVGVVDIVLDSPARNGLNFSATANNLLGTQRRVQVHFVSGGVRQTIDNPEFGNVAADMLVADSGDLPTDPDHDLVSVVIDSMPYLDGPVCESAETYLVEIYNTASPTPTMLPVREFEEIVVDRTGEACPPTQIYLDKTDYENEGEDDATFHVLIGDAYSNGMRLVLDQVSPPPGIGGELFVTFDGSLDGSNQTVPFPYQEQRCTDARPVLRFRVVDADGVDRAVSEDFDINKACRLDPSTFVASTSGGVTTFEGTAFGKFPGNNLLVILAKQNVDPSGGTPIGGFVDEPSVPLDGNNVADWEYEYDDGAPDSTSDGCDRCFGWQVRLVSFTFSVGGVREDTLVDGPFAFEQTGVLPICNVPCTDEPSPEPTPEPTPEPEPSPEPSPEPTPEP